MTFKFPFEQIGEQKTVNNVDFTLGPLGDLNLIQCNGQEIELPSVTGYSQIYMMAFNVDNDIAGIEADFTVNYASGSPLSQTLNISSSLYPYFDPEEYKVLEMSYVIDADGSSRQEFRKIFAYIIDIDSSRELLTLELPDNARIYVAAITLTEDSPRSESPLDRAVTSFPFEDIVYTSTYGKLLYWAKQIVDEEEGPYVRLTEEQSDQYGLVAYSGVLPDEVEVSFEVMHLNTGEDGSPADATFFYCYANERPRTENGETAEGAPFTEDWIEGYVFGFAEFGGIIKFNYGGDTLAFVELPFNASEWYSIRIIFNKVNGGFSIYVNGGLAVQGADPAVESRVFDAGHRKFGFGARCGGLTAQHRIRNIAIQEVVEFGPLQAYGLSPYYQTPPLGVYDITETNEDGDTYTDRSMVPPFVRFLHPGMACIPQEETTVVYILSKVERQVEEGINTELEFHSYDMLNEVYQQITLTSGSEDPLPVIDEVYSMVYYDGFFIVCAVESASFNFYTLSTDGVLTLWRTNIGRALTGMEIQGDDLFAVCYESAAAKVFLYDPIIGENVKDEEDNDVSWVIASMSFGEDYTFDASSISGLAVTTDDPPKMVTTMRANYNGDEEGVYKCVVLELSDVDFSITSVQPTPHELSQLSLVAPDFILGLTNNAERDVSTFYPETIYIVASDEGATGDFLVPGTNQVLRLSYRESDFGEAKLSWNSDDGYVYYLAHRTYNYSGD